MTVILEIKERLKLIYSKFEVVILPFAKFLLAYITLNTLNGSLGYMTKLDNVAVVLMVALLCSVLPVGVLVFFAALISLAHMYALSMEVALVGLCVYLMMYLLFFRFGPKDSLVVVLTPLLCTMKIPYVVPIVVGLLCGPASVVSVAGGVIAYYFLDIVIVNASKIKTMGNDEMIEKIRLMIEGLIGNKAMLVVIAAFAITVLMVYFIRRMSVNYSWTIAIVAGAIIEVVCLLIGDLLYDVNLSLGGVLLGSVLAVAVGMIVHFFRFCVDYSRVEKVQFEDDEYYYYVKAVPKMTVSMSTRTVKRINSQQMRDMPSGGRGGNARQNTYSHDRPSGRAVTTERIAPSRSAGTDRAVSGRNGGQASMRSGDRSNANRERVVRKTGSRINVENTRDLLEEFEEE